MAKVAHWLGMMLAHQGELDAALRLFERSLAIWRGLGDRDEQVKELSSLGVAYRHLGDLHTARSVLQDCVAIAREIGSVRLAGALINLGQAEGDADNFDRASELMQEALALARKQGDIRNAAVAVESLALVGLRAGRAPEARDLLSSMIDYVVSSGNTMFLVDALELWACTAANLGDCLHAARLIGAAEAIREKENMPITPQEQVLLEPLLAPARATIACEEWDAELAVGRAFTQQQAVTLLLSLSPTHGALHDSPSRHTGARPRD